MFLNRDLNEEAKEQMFEHLREAEQRKQARVQDRIEQLAEQKREADANVQELADMKSAEIQIKQEWRKVNIEAIENVKAQRDNTKKMQA